MVFDFSDGKTLLYQKFSNKNIKFLSQLFENGRIISWVSLNNEYKLTNDSVFSNGSAKTRNSYSDIDGKILYQNHHIIKGARIVPSEKLSCKEIYLILISNIAYKPNSNMYFENCYCV